MTRWVGLTGGIGSGKSTVAAQLAGYGVPVIDADALARQLTQAGGAALPAIRAHWGDAVFHNDGSLNRNALREQVFSQAAHKQHLEALLHPLIFDAIQAAQRATPAHIAYGVADIPLLAEVPVFRQLVERIAVVDAAPALQQQRVQQRNGLNEAAIRAIMAQQADRAARLALADDIIDNNGSLAQLADTVAQLHRRYQAWASAPT